MKITRAILSIPPYLSTTWENISSLHTQQDRNSLQLIVILRNGSRVEIPNLSEDMITTILETHARYIETGSQLCEEKMSTEIPFSFFLPLKNDGAMIDTAAQGMQHNPEQANLPPLPQGILDKLVAIAKALGLDTIKHLPKPESNCNCIYCQVVNALGGGHEPEEEVTHEDLQFRDWDIEQTAEHVYIVTNPIDKNESYSVFLGEPLGCTCGQKNCEHIQAVLKT